MPEPSHGAELTRRLGYKFRDSDLLSQALTHRSFSSQNNERLEFLGDALIGAYIAETLYRRHPKECEGGLSRLRSSLVRERSLAKIARGLALGDALLIGEGERKSGGWRRDSVLADALEAIVAAVYLDGGAAASIQVCDTLFAEELEGLPDAESLKDPKTRLQEWLQARSLPLPEYEVIAESGPAHRRSFEVRASLSESAESTEAQASSRRAAEQKAAQALLEKIMAST